MGRFLILIAALLLAGLVAAIEQQPPRPRPSTAPAVEFSADRAFADIRVIGARPHPVGSGQNRRLRDYLVARMQGLGLTPQVRSGPAFTVGKQGAIDGGRVENIVGVLPGRARTAPALLLMAHYDSAPSSPGAADDAAGVAAILETIRALKARGTPERDVLVLFTDGEEAGLLGARAFFQRDPLRERPRFLLNLDARGGGGRAVMFETGPGGGGAVKLLLTTARRPLSSSLAVKIYSLMPNDTDFTVARLAGLVGLNFAILDRHFDYHAPTATPQSLDRGALQDLGDQTLAAAASAAGHALPKRTEVPVYSHLAGPLSLSYPAAAGWVFVFAAAGLIAAGFLQAAQRGAVRIGGVARGGAASVFAAAGAGGLLQSARAFTGAGVGDLSDRLLLAQPARWEATLVLLGLGFVLLSAATAARGRQWIALLPAAAALGGSALGGLDAIALGLGGLGTLAGLFAFHRPTPRAEAWGGALLAGLVALIATQVAAPLAAYLIAWPLLLAAAAAAGSGLAVRRARPYIVLLGAVAVVGVGWLAGAAHLIFLALDTPAALMAPLWLATLVLWPLAQPEEGAPPARLLGPVLLVAGFGLLLVVRLDPPWSARRPEPSYVAYHLDASKRRAWLLSDPDVHGGWAQGVLGAHPVRRSLWPHKPAMLSTPAAYVEPALPHLRLEPLPGGDVRLRVTPTGPAAQVAVRLRAPAPMRLIALGGLPTALPLRSGAWTRVRWSGDPDGLVIDMRGAGPLDVEYAILQPGWPAGAPPLPQRPKEVAPWGTSDSTWIVGRHRLAW